MKIHRQSKKTSYHMIFGERNELDTVKTLTYARQHYPQKTLLGLVDVLVERYNPVCGSNKADEQAL
jgi:hypothetical protein